MEYELECPKCCFIFLWDDQNGFDTEALCPNCECMFGLEIDLQADNSTHNGREG